MKKKVLILGVTGQDGSLLADYLVNKNYLVYGLIRKSSNRNYQNIENLITKKNFKLVQGDLLDFISIENVLRKIKPDEIYNFADQDHVRWSSEIPYYSFDVTAKSVFNILNLIKIHSPKSKYFQPFSSNMFGNTKKRKLTEKDFFSPLSVYAISKVSAFYICEYFKKAHNLKIFLRPSWILLNELPMYKSAFCGDLTEAKNQSKRLINLPSSPHLLDDL